VDEPKLNGFGQAGGAPPGSAGCTTWGPRARSRSRRAGEATAATP